MVPGEPPSEGSVSSELEVPVNRFLGELRNHRLMNLMNSMISCQVMSTTGAPTITYMVRLLTKSSHRNKSEGPQYAPELQLVLNTPVRLALHQPRGILSVK
jgi:hypothetical protein